MAHNIPVLAELIQQNDKGLDDMYVSELLQDAPFLAALFAKEASNGTTHEYLKTTGAPTVGFREIGVGRDHSKAIRTKVTATLKLLDASFHLDAAFAEKHKKGVDAAMETEGVEHVKAAFAMAELQLIYGTGGEADGYTGLAQAETIDGLADNMVVDAGGGANLTSVYLIRTGDTEAALVAGTDGVGQMLSVGERTKQFVPDEDGKLYPAYCSDIHAWLALQIGNAHSIGRICNIDTSDASANGLTDALIAKAFSKFPATRRPNLLLMNTAANSQLQQSRTATNATGAEAPFPEDVFKTPIVMSDAVSSNETAVA